MFVSVFIRLVLSGAAVANQRASSLCGTRDLWQIKSRPYPKHISCIGTRAANIQIFERASTPAVPPNFGGICAPPSRDMPTHTGFVHGDALRRPYCVCHKIYAIRFGLPSKAHSRPQLLCAAPTKRGTLWESRGSWGYLCPLTGLAVFYSRGGLVVNTFFQKVLIQDTEVILHSPELL